MTLFRKMICWIVLPTLGIYVLVLGLAAAYLYQLSLREVEDDMKRLAGNYAARFNGYLQRVATIADVTSEFMSTDPGITDRQVFQQLRSNVEQTPLVYGSCMAFEPGTFKQADTLFGPYVYRGAGGLVEMDINRTVYDWYSDPAYTWFRDPKQTGKGVWVKPYFDEGAGNILMSTYSAPFYVDGVFHGVSTVDIDLARLKATVGQGIVSDLEFAIFTAEGQFVYSPDTSRIMKETLVEFARVREREDIARLADRMLAGDPGMAWIDGWDGRERQLVFFAPIESTNWRFACWIPEAVVLSDVRLRMKVGALSMAATLVLIVLCIFLVSRRITRPIARLNEGVQAIAQGNLEAKVEGVEGRDEVGQLARSFNQMTADLTEHVNRLAHEQSTRERMERDMNLARQIQQSLLPRTKPKLGEFDIAGWSRPADQTGGDYYDWQPLPDGRLAISLADVTGHGIGPALVTTACRAYARASFPTGQELEHLMARINELLAEDLESGRFVTFVVGLLDPVACTMSMLSAGHGPILLYRKASDSVENCDVQGIPLGIDSGFSFESPAEIVFDHGDVLVFVTDGFFEWSSAAGEMFGTDRLEEAVRANAHLSSEEIIEQLYATVTRFVGDVDQDDDLTAVVIKRC